MTNPLRTATGSMAWTSFNRDFIENGSRHFYIRIQDYDLFSLVQRKLIDMGIKGLSARCEWNGYKFRKRPIYREYWEGNRYRGLRIVSKGVENMRAMSSEVQEAGIYYEFGSNQFDRQHPLSGIILSRYPLPIEDRARAALLAKQPYMSEFNDTYVSSEAFLNGSPSEIFSLDHAIEIE